jgi:hypothetical protein
MQVGALSQVAHNPLFSLIRFRTSPG